MSVFFRNFLLKKEANMQRQGSSHNAMTADGHFSEAYILKNGNSLGKDIVNEVKSCFDEVIVTTIFFRRTSGNLHHIFFKMNRHQ